MNPLSNASEALVATYVPRGEPLGTQGCVRSDPHLIHVRDERHDVLGVVPAPPFMTDEAYRSATQSLTPLPGVTFTVHWTIDHIPHVTRHEWWQCFRDGVEQPHPTTSHGPEPALQLSCDYRTFVAYQLGAKQLWEVGGSVQIQRASIGALSALDALTDGDGCLRARGLPPDLIALVTAAL